MKNSRDIGLHHNWHVMTYMRHLQSNKRVNNLKSCPSYLRKVQLLVLGR
jgi:hypothetical protein